MTLFAVACAGLFPLLHLGRPWFFYWLLPYPNTMELWPQFRSPLVWDVFAVSTYATVSLLFWYVGLIPDLATLRDRATEPVRRASSTASWRWAGAARRQHWHRYETAYLLLAGLATPLVVSVHTVVSFDFAVGHRARLALDHLPALLRGRGHLLRLRDGADAGHPDSRRSTAWRTSSRMRHLQNMAKIMLATGLIVAYGYVIEAFMAWYSGNPYEQSIMVNRMFGPYAVWYWALILCNVVIPQVLWLEARAVQPGRCCSSSPWSSTSACGWSATSSSSPACTAISCRRRGACTADGLGLGDLHRHHRPVPDPAVPVPPLPADDLDLRDADAAAGGPGAGGRPRGGRRRRTHRRRRRAGRQAIKEGTP